MRRNDERDLRAGTGHVVRVSRHRESARAVDPEKGAVDRAAVCLPRGRYGAHEFGIALGQDALAVPNSVLEVQIGEARPLARRGQLVALQGEGPVWVGP